jgi:hypothetical protein
MHRCGILTLMYPSVALAVNSLAPPGSPLAPRPRRSMAFPRSGRHAAEDATPENAAFGDQAPRAAAAWRDAGQEGCHDLKPAPQAPVGRFAGKHIAVLRGHDDDVNSAAFSPDGSRIVTASDGNTARIWDFAAAKGIAVLRGHEESVRSAAFGPDRFNKIRFFTVISADPETTADPVSGVPLFNFTNRYLEIGDWTFDLHVASGPRSITPIILKLRMPSSEAPSCLPCVPWKGRWRSPVCGSSLCRPCPRGRFSPYPVCSDASHSSRPCPRCGRICV